LYRAAKAAEAGVAAAAATAGTGTGDPGLDPIALYDRALVVIAPPSLPKDRLCKLPAHCLEMLRDHFRCLIRRERYTDAVVLGTKAAGIFEAMQNDNSMHKQLLCITLLQLKLGDSVAAEQTYTQDHLGRKGYMTASESEVAELFMAAYRDLDAEALAKAQVRLIYTILRES
jgi:hypothetical protein